MKVNEIQIKNFKGIKELDHKFDNTITVISGRVGTGKSSFLQAFRYGLTNEIPYNAVRTGELEANVSVTLEDETVVERILGKPTKRSTKIMGRRTGKGGEVLEETTNVPNEIMKLVTASDTLAALKPDALGALFLDGSVEKKTLKDLMKIMANSDIKEKRGVLHGYEKEEEDEEDFLPADVKTELKALFGGGTFSLETISKAFEEEKKIRRENKAELKVSEVKAKEFTELVKPEYSESEITKKYEEIIVVEKNLANYKKEALAYNKALEAKKEYEKRLTELELSLSLNMAKEPKEADLEALMKAKKELNAEILSQTKIKGTLESNKTWFERTMDELDKPVCPISEKLVCKTDKSGFKTELKEEIHKIVMSISMVQDKVKDLKEALAETEAKILDYRKNKEAWERKKALLNELKRLQKNPVVVPEKPEKALLTKDYTEEKENLKKKLDFLREYKLAEEEYKRTNDLKRKVAVNDFIVKSLDPKGPVIQKFIDTFIDCLEDACNERAELLSLGCEVKMISEDGLKVLFKMNEKKPFLPFSCLSAGERIFAALLMTDLVNSFSDSRILVLDNTDNLDAAAFRLLMDFVTNSEITELYDNILICCVEHADILDVVKDYDIDYMYFE